MKKVVLPAVALVVLFCGCFFEDNSKKSYNENIVDVSSDGTYSFKAELQTKDAYLVCYNDSGTSEKSSDDSYSWEASGYSTLSGFRNSSRIANAKNNDAEIKSVLNMPKRIDYIQKPVDFKLIPASDSRAVISKSLPDYTGSSAQFYLDEGYGYKQVTAEKKAEGKHCRVWYYGDSSIESPSDSIFQDLADWFDKIYPIETALLCSNVPTQSYTNIIDVTKSTKINILVYDLFDDYEETVKTNGGTFGFFSYNDMFTDSLQYYGKTIPTNKCEMFYVDTYFLTEKNADGKTVLSEMMISTLAHEFQHMLGFVQKGLNYNLDEGMGQTWYTEMLSMLTEEFFVEYLGIPESAGPQARLSEYLFGSAYGFSSWDSSGSTTVYYNYANAYAFGAYLARNFGGVDLIQRIFRNRYTDENSIVHAVEDSGYGYDFSELLALFSAVQVYTDDSSHISLCKSGSKTVGGGNLSYPEIDLGKFRSILLPITSKQTFDSFLEHIYSVPYINSTCTTDDGKYLMYKGPIYYKANPSVNVKPTGSYIVHLGNIKEFSMDKSSSLKYYILFK